MLSLARNIKQSIYIMPNSDIDPNMTVKDLFINGAIKVTLYQISKSRDQAKIGVAAPYELDIIREELLIE